MYADIQDAVDGEVQCIVAANKADLRDENGSDLVPKEEYDKIKKEFKCEVLETSAKTGTNIEDLYIHLIKLIIGGGSSKAPSQKTEKKEPKKQEDSGGCCNIA
ncbi:RAS1 protein [Tritrichomonas musculus]